ncbi:unnamed protein product, partial [Symbiodinium microadriaticum]
MKGQTVSPSGNGIPDSNSPPHSPGRSEQVDASHPPAKRKTPSDPIAFCDIYDGEYYSTAMGHEEKSRREERSSEEDNCTDGDGALSAFGTSSGPSILPVKLLRLSNGKYVLVPAGDEDSRLLCGLFCESTPASSRLPCRVVIDITSTEEVSGNLPSASLPIVPTPISSAALPNEKKIVPKHIYKTSGDSYRVQVSTGSKFKPNKKFSRNVRSELDALWLVEFALILIDGPASLEDIISNGNFHCLVQR